MQNVNRACNLLRQATTLLSERLPDSSNSGGNYLQTTQTSNITVNAGSSQSSICSETEPANNASPSETDSVISTSTFKPSSAGPSTSAAFRPGPASTGSQQSILNNFRALFSPYARPSSHVSSLATRGTPKRPVNSTRASAAKKVKTENWTHEMFCLAKASRQTVPNREERGASTCWVRAFEGKV